MPRLDLSICDLSWFDLYGLELAGLDLTWITCTDLACLDLTCPASTCPDLIHHDLPNLALTCSNFSSPDTTCADLTWHCSTVQSRSYSLITVKFWQRLPSTGYWRFGSTSTSIPPLLIQCCRTAEYQEGSYLSTNKGWIREGFKKKMSNLGF